MTNSNKPNVSSKYEEERLRAAEQSQIVYLQGQIDELRRLLKEQTNKYNWAMEQIRRVEASVSQIDGVFDRHRQEVVQALDLFRREIATLRKEVAGALVKVEESNKPVREMQSQIHQLGEARRQDREHVSGWLSRIEELEQRVLNWQAQIKDSEERHRSLNGKIEGLANVDDSVRTDIRKLNEELQVEKQSLRRQAVEAQQLVADVRPQIESNTNRINRLDEIRKQIERFSEQLPAQISALDVKITEQVGETKRVERISTERFLMNQERLEEVRQQQDERIEILQETDETNLRQLTAWLERVDGWVRELEQRQGRTTTRIDEMRREHQLYLNDLDQRDIDVIGTMLGALRGQFEKIKTEQVERGRAPAEPAS